MDEMVNAKTSLGAMLLGFWVLSLRKRPRRSWSRISWSATAALPLLDALGSEPHELVESQRPAPRSRERRLVCSLLSRVESSIHYLQCYTKPVSRGCDPSCLPA